MSRKISIHFIHLFFFVWSDSASAAPLGRAKENPDICCQMNPRHNKLRLGEELQRGFQHHLVPWKIESAKRRSRESHAVLGRQINSQQLNFREYGLTTSKLQNNSVLSRTRTAMIFEGISRPIAWLTFIGATKKHSRCMIERCFGMDPIQEKRFALASDSYLEIESAANARRRQWMAVFIGQCNQGADGLKNCKRKGKGERKMQYHAHERNPRLLLSIRSRARFV